VNRLLFGTAGIPLSTDPPSIPFGIERLAELGLGGMELEFVHSVNVSEKGTSIIRDAAKKHNILLTCHGQYYINLCSKEKEKVDASVERILLAARRAHQCGAWSMTFHAGFYMGEPADKVFAVIKDRLKAIITTLKREGIPIWVRPETTGKATQFGSLLIRIRNFVTFSIRSNRLLVERVLITCTSISLALIMETRARRIISCCRKATCAGKIC
jgi:deoxyribonuclease IV